MDGRRYLKERPDVSPEEVEHIIELAHKIQEDEIHPVAPLQHATGPDMDVGYLERAVSLHRSLRGDAAKVASVRAEEERAQQRRVITVGIAFSALLFAAIVTFYSMGSMGAAEIDAAGATFAQSEHQLSRAVDDYASLSAELIVASELEPAAFDRSLRRAREATSVEERVTACDELELALNTALARQSPLRQAAARAQQQALMERWVTEHSRLRHESEYFDRAKGHYEEERSAPMGRVARFFGLVGKGI